VVVTSIPRAANPYSHPTDGVFVCIRPQTLIGGVTLHRGDSLPADSPLRKSARRLEQLCRQRVLAPQLEAVRPAQAPNVATAPVEAATPNVDYRSLSVAELRDLCVSLGLKTHGNRFMLAKRLQQHQAAA
jgi:hypothetical protein